MARLAHQLAMESDRVTADVVEANEFPSYSARYAVSAVPKTVANDRVEVLGAMPESRFLQEVLKALPDDGARNEDSDGNGANDPRRGDRSTGS